MTSHWLHIILIQMTKDTFCDINIRKDYNINGNQIRKIYANWISSILIMRIKDMLKNLTLEFRWVRCATFFTHWHLARGFPTSKKLPNNSMTSFLIEHTMATRCIDREREIWVVRIYRSNSYFLRIELHLLACCARHMSHLVDGLVQDRHDR